MTIKNLTYLCAPVCAMMFFSACTHKKEIAKDAGFAVTDSLIKRLLVDTVSSASSSDEKSFTGKIQPVEDNMVKIFPMVSGIIGNVHVHTGDYVKKGQVLATLGSTEMAGYASQATSAEAGVNSAKRSLQVAEDLYKSGIASEKELEDARAQYRIAQAENARAREVLQLNPGRGGSSYIIRSPISGYVIEKNVTDNMQVRADNPESLFTVADLTKMWVMINIYESDVSEVKAGDAVKITTLSYPDKMISGTIDKVYNVIDSDDKVMKARVLVDNPGGLLKPEMFATVKVNSHNDNSYPVINSRCLVFDNNKNYVIVTDGKRTARIQEVEVARKVEDHAYISNGVKPGDKLIASRQLYLFEGLKN